jgi:hypothetical protein
MWWYGTGGVFKALWRPVLRSIKLTPYRQKQKNTGGSIRMTIAIFLTKLAVVRIGRREQAPEPPKACRRLRLRSRRATRFPPHSKGVGSSFHPRPIASSQAIISAGDCGFCPSKALRTKMRWIDCHIQPGTTHGCVQRHHAMLK